MANKVITPFAMRFRADGGSATLVIPLAATPWSIIPPIPGAVPLLATVLQPTAATDCTSSAGVVVTSNILLGILTVTFAAVPTAGDYVLQGNFVY